MQGVPLANHPHLELILQLTLETFPRIYKAVKDQAWYHPALTQQQICIEECGIGIRWSKGDIFSGQPTG